MASWKVGLTLTKATAARSIPTSSPAASASGQHRPQPGGGREVVLADEPTSMLDVSIRIGILNPDGADEERARRIHALYHPRHRHRPLRGGRSGGDVRGATWWSGARWTRYCTTPSIPIPSCSSLGGARPRKSIHAELEWGAARGNTALDPESRGCPFAGRCHPGHAPLQGEPAPVTKLADNHFVRCYLANEPATQGAVPRAQVTPSPGPPREAHHCPRPGSKAGWNS